MSVGVRLLNNEWRDGQNPAIMGQTVNPAQHQKEMHKLKDENKSLRQQVLELNSHAKAKDKEIQRLMTELGEAGPPHPDGRGGWTLGSGVCAQDSRTGAEAHRS